jgi:predicted RNA methylase
MLSRIAGLLPTHTRRTQESEEFQQFSTPMPLAYVASIAAGLTGDDAVLEPSAGTGMLAVFAEIMGARLALNEIADTRAALLRRLFPDSLVSTHDAASIDDRLADEIAPSVVLMNPPFSAALHVQGRVSDADFHHVRSALARLPEGGRLVAITGHNFPVDKLNGTVRFTCVVDGSVYYKHGTTFDTRLTVIDKSLETASPPVLPRAENAADLLARVIEHLVCPLKSGPP